MPDVLTSIGGIPITKPGGTGALKILVYGNPGSGKTYLVGTAPDDLRSSPTLLLDFEAGTLSIEGKNVDVVRITSFKQFNEVYAFLQTQKHYKMVVLDSGTETQKLNMYGIMADMQALQPHRDPDRPQIDDWGKSAEQMRKLLRYLRDLPLHVVVTALAQEYRDERDGTIYCKPSMPGKLADEICGMFDLVGYLGVATVREGEGPTAPTKDIRRMLWQPTAKYIAKDRSGKLGPFMDEPSFAKIMTAVYGPVKK